jgi:hypothetical protein
MVARLPLHFAHLKEDGHAPCPPHSLTQVGFFGQTRKAVGGTRATQASPPFPSSAPAPTDQSASSLSPSLWLMLIGRNELRPYNSILHP